MNRTRMLDHIKAMKEQTWDIVVIGGGATGLGCAVEAATRGYKTLLLEQVDFAKGTSSRSTKLVHGGVRYLAQGNFSLVLEALRERGLLRQNAPHLVRSQVFVIPNYKWWQGSFYTIGLKIYDIMAGRLGLGGTRYISKRTILKTLPNINPKGLRGGVVYYDGQFDDARLAINLAQTFVEHGGTILNYAKVTDLLKSNNISVNGVRFEDLENKTIHEVSAKVVINATGVFVDNILKMDNTRARNIVKPSQGVHIVLDKSFLQGSSAIMIPKTDDGRVLFLVPWYDKVIVGTTDTGLDKSSLEPKALEEEVAFILTTASRYLAKSPSRRDVLSVFAGLRPLAAPKEGRQNTKEISRNHKLIVSPSGLITIVGGKWTTYRKMGQDTIDKAIKTKGLKEKKSISKSLPIHGFATKQSPEELLYIYGSDASAIRQLMVENKHWKKKLHPNLSYTEAEVIWAVRQEMARTVEDVLARRLRALFLDAKASIEASVRVAQLMATELDYNKEWQKEQVQTYTKLAKNYLLE